MYGWIVFAIVGGASLCLCLASSGPGPETPAAKSVFDFTVKDVEGIDVKLSDYKGGVLMIVNVASR